jgi:hypothetical protein
MPDEQNTSARRRRPYDWRERVLPWILFFGFWAWAVAGIVALDSRVFCIQWLKSVAWFGAAAGVGLGVWGAAANYQMLWMNVRRGEHHSLVPLIGGAAGALGVAAIPVTGAGRWAWIPLVADPGCIPILVATGVYLVFLWGRSWWKGKS